MTSGSLRFDRFRLDPRDRQLRRDGTPVELNARYLDALILLVREGGRLVSKDRFLDEVWRGVPVTDEALTQCIKTLRRQLGDDAAAPRFIETVPKHGYRFIAPVQPVDAQPELQAAAPEGSPQASAWRGVVQLGLAGTLGGAVAGVFGGLFYGFGAAAQPVQSGMGSVSVLLVLLCVTVALAAIGAAGVSFGVAAAGHVSGRDPRWGVLGGAAGGLVVGALVKLIGLDAFSLLLGRSPGAITGAPEGALLGAAVGLGAWLATRGPQGRSSRGISAAGLIGGAAGILIALAGGRLLGGSLDLLARAFPGSRLRLDAIGAFFGEAGFGSLTHIVTSGLEGLLFGACVVGGMLIARQSRSEAA